MQKYRGQRIVILGLARQGQALARYLAQAGAQVVVSDLRPAEQLQAARAALQDLTIEYVLGEHPASLLQGADRLCLSGGVDANLPLAQAARQQGVPLSNDSQIFLEDCPPGVITLGVTGSAGKTTTTTLVGRILEAAGAGRVWVGGNIGNPLLAALGQMRAGDFAVLELSSFQLEIMTCAPQVAAVLNITPNHLDRHGTMEVYTAAKSQILRHQPSDGEAVLAWDDPGARALRPLVRGALAFFSGREMVEQGACLRGQTLLVRRPGCELAVAERGQIQLRGWHNVLNVLAACALGAAALARRDPELRALPRAVGAALAGFSGVEHRLEFVRERRGARWYNDSIASAPERVVAALHSFDEPLVVLCGGRDKKLPWEALAALARERVKHLVLFGEAGPLVERALQAAGVPAGRYTRCATLQAAVAEAAGRTEPGDVVLLSPGGTSFDEFRDFAERGDRFKTWVHALPD